MTYILMKASRSPANGVAPSIREAYRGFYTQDYEEAKKKAEEFYYYNPVGFVVWEVGNSVPLCATCESYWAGMKIPRIKDIS